MTKNDNIFPKNFLWGTSTAAHQVEGDNTNSDWWEWEHSKPDVEESGKATDHYNLFAKDFDLVKNTLHNNAHRLSIEWARIEPSEGEFSQKEILHYRKVFTELKKRKIKIMLTLSHFTLPLWFAAKGGWEVNDNLKHFERFVRLVVKEYGDAIDFWCIFNEPNIYLVWSYLKGFWPPEKKSLVTALRVYFNLARMHKSAYEIIHKRFPQAMVSSAINMTYFKGEDLPGTILAKILTFISNYSFIFLSKKYDYMAINSYFFKPIKISEISKMIHFKKSQMMETLNGNGKNGWLFYPQGIYYVTSAVWNKYKLPIMITENGISDKKDTIRPKYLLDNLGWIKAAIDEGVDIRGYFHWSLMDNIEWMFGHNVRFGLFETDYKTMKRTPRKSALIYGEICKTNSLEAASKYKI